MSKSHPNCSEEFIKKLETRQKRTQERALLQQAKEIYFKKYNVRAIIYRPQLTAIKKQLKMELVASE